MSPMNQNYVRIKLRKNQSTLPVEKLNDQITNLEILGDSIETLPSLEHLHACESLMIICPELGDLPKLPPQLKRLKLKKGGRIKGELPDTLVSLQISALRKSEDMAQLKLPASLEVLDLSANQLESVEYLQFGTRIQRLNLDQNQLTTLPASLYQLPDLLHLSLDGNPLLDEQRDKIYKKFGIWF